MSLVPNVSAATLAKARQVWEEVIDQYGRDVTLYDVDGNQIGAGPVKAFCKRPKILGLFDRTQASFDQEKYTVLLKETDFGAVDPEKFLRVNWDDEDHSVISVTKVELQGTTFGYRLLVKG